MSLSSAKCGEEYLDFANLFMTKDEVLLCPFQWTQLYSYPIIVLDGSFPSMVINIPKFDYMRCWTHT